MTAYIAPFIAGLALGLGLANFQEIRRLRKEFIEFQYLILKEIKPCLQKISEK